MMKPGSPLDLSLSMLRFVSPIHIEYLKNMGVGASLSISIIVDGRTLGVVRLSSLFPLVVRHFKQRSVSELFAQMFAMRLESSRAPRDRGIRTAGARHIGSITRCGRFRRNPAQRPGLACRYSNPCNTGRWCRCLDQRQLCILRHHAADRRCSARIIRALNGTAAGKVYATDQLSTLVKGMDDQASVCAGLLAIPISRSPRDYVVLFRSELIRSVRWAGDPHKPVNMVRTGRGSRLAKALPNGKSWSKGRSKPFTTSELRVAETLRATLIEVVLRLADEAAAERHQASARQELLIAELNHRVRNILGVIRGLIRQSQPERRGGKGVRPSR